MNEHIHAVTTLITNIMRLYALLARALKSPRVILKFFSRAIDSLIGNYRSTYVHFIRQPDYYRSRCTSFYPGYHVARN